MMYMKVLEPLKKHSYASLRNSDTKLRTIDSRLPTSGLIAGFRITHLITVFHNDMSIARYTCFGNT
jgi:hypothetical protein